MADGSDWDDDPDAFRPPLPPEDRLWRHPSELGAVPATPVVASGSRRPTIAFALVAVAAGSLLLAGLVSLVLSRSGEADELTASTLPLAGSPVTTLALTDAVSGVVPIVAVTPDGDRAGVAVVVEGTGLLVTTVGAIADATSVLALLPDGSRVEATLAGTDSEGGAVVLAIVEAPAPARTGRARALRPGDMVATAGPGPDTARVVSLGASAKSTDDLTLHHLVEVDLPPDASVVEGEPLVDASGAIVALCTRADDGDVVAVPAEVVRAAARSVAATGRLAVPWLGVSGRDASNGALIASVRDDSPADDGGLEAGDTVVAVDGQAVPTMAALALAVRDQSVGDAVTLTVRRDGEEQALAVTLGEKP